MYLMHLLHLDGVDCVGHGTKEITTIFGHVQCKCKVSRFSAEPRIKFGWVLAASQSSHDLDMKTTPHAEKAVSFHERAALTLLISLKGSKVEMESKEDSNDSSRLTVDFPLAITRSLHWTLQN